MSERLTRFFASRWGIVLAGAVIGLLAPLLQKLGNPPNMGICVACFERDIAGALGLHRAAVVQYIRPEIIGFVLGAMLAAYVFGEFRARAGSAPIVRFVLGMLAMIGALAFLGCPWRALLRLSGGDLRHPRPARPDDRHCHRRRVPQIRLQPGPLAQDLHRGRLDHAPDHAGPVALVALCARV
jgi:hypothetical protein